MLASRPLAWYVLLAVSAACAPAPIPALPPPLTTAMPQATHPVGSSYRDAHLAVADRVADLLARMTLDEKIAQLGSVNWEHTRLDDSDHHFSVAEAERNMPNGIGEITRPGDRHDAAGALAFANAAQHFLVERTRLGIPAILHEEALHGLVAPGATSFPQAIALAATFDPAIVEQALGVAARQARARGVQHVLAPVLDVARDPRWGRIEETYGEDPFLVSRMGVAAVFGLQGRRPIDSTFDESHVIATAKHMTGHGQPEGGRNTAPGNGSPHALREVFLPPFEAAVREAGVGAVMASYNEVDGMPSHANHWLLSELLRAEWGFSGMVVSDYFGVAELERKHHVAADLSEAARTAIEAGVDVELPELEGFKALADEVKAGRLPVSVVDDAVRRVLRAKFLLGLFERPYVDGPLEGERPSDRALALRVAEEAIVLLKNDGQLLPLDAARIKSIAVIGPNAAACRLGGYSGYPDHAVSLAEGISVRAGARVKVASALGCGLTKGNRGWMDDVVELADEKDDAHSIAEAVRLAQASDVAILALGQNEQLSREAWSDDHRGDRMSLDLVGRQMDLARAVLATGRPTVVVLIHGGPLAIPEIAKSARAILDGFYLGEETGNALAAVLFGDVSPAGRLPISVPRGVGTVPAFYNAKPSAGRLYLFEEAGPLWPFGFGLSYTTFEYGNPSVTPARIPPDGRAHVTLRVTNTGVRASDEVVQAYVRDRVSSVTRPLRELKWFRRVHIEAGAAQDLGFDLGASELSFFDAKMDRVVEPGVFEVTVGGSSVEGKTARFEVVRP